MVQRIYNYAATPGVNPTPAPAPAVPDPVAPAPAAVAPWATRGAEEEWWRRRGGHQLYDLFAQIYGKNQMAGRAFWDAVVGRGSGQNDLMAATIHKMFGGDMNAYNNWRNQLHHSGQESQAGYFDLATGKWNNMQGQTWAYDGDWAGLKKGFDVGLQSLPGQHEAGAESWQTYLANPYQTPAGVRYGEQFGGVPVPKQPARPGGTSIPTPTGPSISVPPPAAGPAAPPPTPVNPYPSTPVNPHGVSRGGYRYQARN